jgi:hypothetical protein
MKQEIQVTVLFANGFLLEMIFSRKSSRGIALMSAGILPALMFSGLRGLKHTNSDAG